MDTLIPLEKNSSTIRISLALSALLHAALFLPFSPFSIKSIGKPIVLAPLPIEAGSPARALSARLVFSPVIKNNLVEAKAEPQETPSPGETNPELSAPAPAPADLLLAQTPAPSKSAISAKAKPRPKKIPESAVKNLFSFYPAEALAQELEGEVIVLLARRALEEPFSAELAKSSGHAILDEAALRAANHVAPQFVSSDQLEYLFPVSFRMKR